MRRERNSWTRVYGRLDATSRRCAQPPIPHPIVSPARRPRPFHQTQDALPPPRRRFVQPQIPQDDTRINEQIRGVYTVRLVDESGSRIVSFDEALAEARRRELDLVEIAPQADPVVVKIIDYGKFRYEQQKREKEQRKKAATVEVKEIRFRPHTDTHDFDFKVKHARQFLSEGDKVKAWVQFRGRDIVYKEAGVELLTRFAEALSDLGKLEQEPTMEGRRMTVFFAPNKKKA
ncbi:MAG: translation initiation factor IF-3 [Rhodothermales bacterium]|nr:translation initiation factor IF-3 [Rhodothermales bacterium]